MDWIQIQFILCLGIHFQLFICLWFVVHHGLPQKFILCFRLSFASSKLFNVHCEPSLQVYWLFQLHYSRILGPLHSSYFFFCVPYILHICVVHRTQFHYYYYTIQVSHQLYRIISIHIFSTVSITYHIISHSISYNNFHICFHSLPY